MGWFEALFRPPFASLNDVNRMKAEGHVKGLLKILRDYNQVAEAFAFTDPRYGIAVAAAEALASIGEPAVEHIIEALDVTVIQGKWQGNIFNKSDGTGYLDPMNSVGYYQAVLALGKIGDERAIDILYKIICISEEELGDAPEEALTLINGEKAVDIFIKILNDNIPVWAFKDISLPILDFMKNNAVLALGAIAQEKGCEEKHLEKAIQPLFKTTKDSTDFVRKSAIQALENFPKHKITIAKQHEKLLEFDEAAKIYKELEMDDELIRIRKLKSEQGAVKVSQKVVHGDEITKTDIRDSVVSKSSIGGGSSKMQELKELTEMKKEGLIDAAEFLQMKKEILGK